MEQTGQISEHKLSLHNRKKLELTGVVSMGAFNEQEIVLDSHMGKLHLKGEDLHITHLNLDEGTMTLEGLIKGILYSESKSKQKGKNLLSKVLR